MSQYLLCVTGTTVLGGAQRLSVVATTLEELLAGIQQQVEFYPPTMNRIVALSIADEEFNEYVLVQQLAGLPAKAKVCVQCVESAPAASEVQRSATAYVLDTVINASALRGSLTADGLLRAVDTAVLSPGNCDWTTNPAFGKLRAAVAATEELNAQAAASRAAAAAAPVATQRSGGGFADDSMDDSVAASRSGGRKAAPPSRARKATPTREPAPAAYEAPAAPKPVPQQQPAAPINPNMSDTVTVYCVYSGAHSQRAKAVRVDRYKPYLQGVCDILRSKFRADVTLGFIYEDGSCTEVLTDEDLRTVIDLHKGVDAITLHCWSTPNEAEDGSPSAPELVNHSASMQAIPNRQHYYQGQQELLGNVSGVSSVTPQQSVSQQIPAPQQQQQPVAARRNTPPPAAITKANLRSNNAAIGGRSPAADAVSVGGRSRKSARSYGGRSAKSRATSRASTATTRFAPEEKIEDAKLRQLFDELDIDGSGDLDREEFRTYFHANYDPMGIDDVDKKFDEFLAKCGAMDDGRITFEEFAIVILKLQQF